MFIVLTSPTAKDFKIRFHVHNIVKFEPKYKVPKEIVGSFISTIDSAVSEVTESPEEIDKLLMESYVSVKDLSRPVSS